MRPESEYFLPSDDCLHPELWMATDDMASEAEVGDFLYGLVRLLKPSKVIETGSYRGDTSIRIAEALRENQYGHLTTFEIKPDLVEIAVRRLEGLSATVIQGDALEVLDSEKFDLAFLDSDGDRAEEVKRCTANWIVLHDSRWPTLKIEKSGYVKMFFPTPRGITLYGKA